MKFINFLQKLITRQEAEEDSNNIALLQSTLAQTKILKSKHPMSYPIQSIANQLEYLIDIESGKSTDFSKLESINIGIITAREVEDIDMPLANKLYEVTGLVEKMAVKYCGR